MISAILAVDINNIIGKNGSLPWPHINEDMQWFKRKTEHNVVVMGRATWESLGKYAPLKNRINVVISSNNIGGADRVISENILNEIQSLEEIYPEKEIFIIGGAKLYNSTEQILNKVYLTRILKEFEGDTTIDIENLLKDTRVLKSEQIHSQCHDIELLFNTYEKKRDDK